MKKSSLLAVSFATALSLAACGSASESDDQGSSAAAPEAGAAITIAKPDGAVATESNNPFVADASGNKLGYLTAILEPLAFVSPYDPEAELTTWLASDVQWSEDYTSVTVTARDGVTWNDGTAFTADDIAFSYQMYLDRPELDVAALGLTGVSQDGSTVTLTFAEPMFVKQGAALGKYILPKHIWEGVEDPTTEVNLEPVGTGPYVLEQFTSQSVELTARDDYWGGDLAVPTLYYVSYNDNTALTTALATGDADWAQAFIPNVQSAYLDKDPEHNIYWAPASFGIDTMYMNLQEKPFDDVAFREAVNMVVDRDKHAEIAREGGVPALESVTGMPTPVGDAYISDTYAGQSYEVDVDGARAVLADAGYTWDGDTLVDPDGETVTFELQVPQGWNDYVTGISLIADAVLALGVEATVNTPDVDTWWNDKSIGDFQAILHWTDGGSTPYEMYKAMMSGAWLVPMGEAANNNFGRFDSPEATAALDAFADATDDATRAAAIATVQEIFVENVVTIPVGTRPSIGEFNTRNYVGWPSDEDPYADPNPTLPSAVLILTSLEPAS